MLLTKHVTYLNSQTDTIFGVFNTNNENNFKCKICSFEYKQYFFSNIF